MHRIVETTWKRDFHGIPGCAPSRLGEKPLIRFRERWPNNPKCRPRRQKARRYRWINDEVVQQCIGITQLTVDLRYRVKRSHFAKVPSILPATLSHRYDLLRFIFNSYTSRVRYGIETKAQMKNTMNRVSFMKERIF